ncbi:GNAT family N-acetyltransferase [Streptomyces telluris]|uniref:GNAT family N-acetyltransferase n=1 Tax=Streptomyces telluris TaxID=2720021 RepID=A0A9X2LLU8_9ACTN|nr:GNAT family N-acetyltransferase [Streptomyces telluris]MCQ8773304.1 GNAT family N-acetyltransferase [Streptomyces telluris]NJP80459.1 GNAT family N-acetyltransferase [Streptomyces telluris]
MTVHQRAAAAASETTSPSPDTSPSLDSRPASVPGIRRARPEERDAISLLLGESFMEDPVSGWVFPDEAHRRAVHPGFFGVFLDAALRDGWVDVTDDLSAAALWIPVQVDGAGDACADADADAGEGEGDGGDEEMSELLAMADPENDRARIVAELTEAAHPGDRAHYYLPTIVAAPGRRGEGRGRALLTTVLDRCDEEGMPAYLEASNARSRGLYERLGFALTGTPIDLPDGGPRMWPMWREPRG